METSLIQTGLTILAAGAVVGAVVRLQRRYRFLQYLFFLRAPIAHALLLVLLPLAVTGPFHNFFVVTPPQLVVIVLLLIVNAWAVTYTWGLLFVGSAPRFSLRFHQPDIDQEKGWDTDPRPNRIMAILATERRRAYLVPIILGTPVVVTCLNYSVTPWQWKALAIVSGCLLAVIVREGSSWMVNRFRRWFYAPEASYPPSHWLDIRRYIRSWTNRVKDGWIGRALVSAFASGYSDLSSDDPRRSPIPAQEKDPPFSHWRAAALFLLALAIYVLGAFALEPSLEPNIVADNTPAMAYVLLVLILVGLLLPAVTFLVDFYRVPLVAVVALLLFWSYQRSDLDHYYDFAAGAAGEPLTAAQLVDRWSSTHDASKYPVMVVVAASGGGSHAARWTTEVLYRLSKQPGLAETFLPSISLISAVSGGALGTMYAVDQFTNTDQPLTPDADRLAKAREAASHSNVGALAWGIAYPDLVRKVLPGLFYDERSTFKWTFDARRDRAWALEQTWRSVLSKGSRDATLASWTAGAASRVQPAVVFNATVTETGKRLLLSRVHIPGTSAEEFSKLYAGRDLSIVTAVRLSAAFPYLSPMARPWSPYAAHDAGAAAFESIAYHVADGGYYDGSGVLTAAEFVNAVAEQYRSLGRRKILLVDIRTKTDPAPRAAARKNWLSGLVVPLSTAFYVSSSSQDARAAFELDLLRKRWSNNGMNDDAQVSIESVVFHFNGTGQLPWHLSDEDKNEISNAWCNNKENRQALNDTLTFFTGSPAVPDADECTPPQNVAAERLPVGVVKDVGDVDAERQSPGKVVVRREVRGGV
jgi:hypothetical protein